MRAVQTVLAVVLFMCVGSGGARADWDGNWWYEQQEVAQAHAEGLTGEGVQVAVIALGITPDLPVLAGANLTIHEPSFCRVHPLDSRDGRGSVPAVSDSLTLTVRTGSNAVAFIAGNGRGADGRTSVSGVAPDADIRFYAVGDIDSGFTVGSSTCPTYVEAATARAIVQAVDDGARIVAVLNEGQAKANTELSDAVAYALHEKVVLLVPADWADWKGWMQALNGVVAVGSSGPNDSFSGPPSTVVAAPGVEILVEGEGNSAISQHLPAALVAGMLAVVAQKWPEATNDQLVQAVVHGTVPPVSANGYEQHGYGLINLPQMLQDDPTEYPDENPLIEPDDGQMYGLTAEDIRAAGRPAWADPLPGSALAQSQGESGWVGFVVGSVAAVAFGLVALRVLSARDGGGRTRQSDISTE